eukprot:scaffold7876_cov417-Prasinococcus_capsulatus_cf.AAC.7
MAGTGNAALEALYGAEGEGPVIVRDLLESCVGLLVQWPAEGELQVWHAPAMVPGGAGSEVLAARRGADSALWDAAEDARAAPKRLRVPHCAGSVAGHVSNVCGRRPEAGAAAREGGADALDGPVPRCSRCSSSAWTGILLVLGVAVRLGAGGVAGLTKMCAFCQGQEAQYVAALLRRQVEQLLSLAAHSKAPASSHHVHTVQQLSCVLECLRGALQAFLPSTRNVLVAMSRELFAPANHLMMAYAALGWGPHVWHTCCLEHPGQPTTEARERGCGAVRVRGPPAGRDRRPVSILFTLLEQLRHSAPGESSVYGGRAGSRCTGAEVEGHLRSPEASIPSDLT